MKPDPNLGECEIPGIPDRLFDGYDCDGPQPSDEKIQQLLAAAPPEVRARAAEFARQLEAASPYSGSDCRKPGADDE